MLSTMNQIAYDDPSVIVKQFALDEAQLEAFQRFGKDTLMALVEQFRLPSEGPRALEMIPELLVRHAGGTVFQEAHFEIIRSSPTDLFSLPGRAEVKIDTRGELTLLRPRWQGPSSNNRSAMFSWATQ